MRPVFVPLVIALTVSVTMAFGQGEQYRRGQVISLVDAVPTGPCTDSNLVIVRAVQAIPPALYVCVNQTFQSLIPAGLVAMVVTGACPVGWMEVPALNGRMVRGTLAANVNVGMTGGADSVVHSHAYTQVPTHTHGFSTVRGLGTGTATTSISGLAPGPDTTSTEVGLMSDAPSGSVGSGTTATATHDNRPAFTNVIFCQKS